MSKTRVITDVPDEELNFVLELLKFQSATTSVAKQGSTWTVTAIYPDAQSARESASVVHPAPLATDTAAEAIPSYLPTGESIKPPILGNTFAELAEEYRRNYDLLAVDGLHEKEIKLRQEKLRANKARYVALSDRTGIPWQFIGIVHMMEGNCNFSTHLHNGDPLSERTKRVPEGRPLKGDPPFSWEESALDALEYEGFTKLHDWNVATMLYRFEKFNGMGYRSRGIYSPYLWSYSNLYRKGRFTEDHHFDPSSISKQCGAAILLKRLLAED